MSASSDAPEGARRQTPPPLVRIPPPRPRPHRSRILKVLIALGLAFASLAIVRKGYVHIPSFDRPEELVTVDTVVAVVDTVSPRVAQARAAIDSAFDISLDRRADRRDALAYAVSLCRNPEAECDLRTVTLMGRELMGLRRTAHPRTSATPTSWRR